MDIQLIDTDQSSETIKRLLCIMHEEVLANGGSFISPDSDLWLRQLADEMNPVSSLEIIENLIKEYDPTKR